MEAAPWVASIIYCRRGAVWDAYGVHVGRV